MIQQVQCGGSIYAVPVIASVTVNVGLDLSPGFGSESVSEAGSVSGSGSRSAVRSGLEPGSRVSESEVSSRSVSTLGQGSGVVSLVATVAYVCTTQGKLLALSRPIKKKIQNKNKMNCTDSTCNAGSSLQVYWSYHADAPIFSTPVVTSKITTKKYKKIETLNMKNVKLNEMKIVNNNVELIDNKLIEIIRNDIVVFGVVDGSIRCLSINYSIILNESDFDNTQKKENSTQFNDENIDAESIRDNYSWVGKDTEKGVELWRFSYASHPIFTSICIHRDQPIKTFYSFYFDSIVDFHDSNNATCDSEFNRVHSHDIIEDVKFTDKITDDENIENGHHIEITKNNKNNENIENNKSKENIRNDNDDNDGSDVIMFGSHDGYLRGINLCGEILFETDLGSVLFSSPCVVVVCGVPLVVAATSAGSVYLLNCAEIYTDGNYAENTGNYAGNNPGNCAGNTENCAGNTENCAGNTGMNNEIDNGLRTGINSTISSGNNNQTDADSSREIDVEVEVEVGHDEACGSEVTIADKNKIYPRKNEKPAGTVLSQIRLNGEIYSSPVICEDIIFIGGRDDKIHAIKIKCVDIV